MARRLGTLWGQLNGRLLASGGAPLRPDMPVVDALDLSYFTAVEWMGKEDRLAFDGHVTVTAAQLADFTQEQKEQRMRLAMDVGEVSTHAGVD